MARVSTQCTDYGSPIFRSCSDSVCRLPLVATSLPRCLTACCCRNPLPCYTATVAQTAIQVATSRCFTAYLSLYFASCNYTTARLPQCHQLPRAACLPCCLSLPQPLQPHPTSTLPQPLQPHPTSTVPQPLDPARMPWLHCHATTLPHTTRFVSTACATGSLLHTVLPVPLTECLAALVSHIIQSTPTVPCPPPQRPHSTCFQEELPAAPAGLAHDSVPVELVLCSRKEMLRPRHNMPRRGPLWHGVPSLPPRCLLALALALLLNPSPAFLFSFRILCFLVLRKLKSRTQVSSACLFMHSHLYHFLSLHTLQCAPPRALAQATQNIYT